MFILRKVNKESLEITSNSSLVSLSKIMGSNTFAVLVKITLNKPQIMLIIIGIWKTSSK